MFDDSTGTNYILDVTMGDSSRAHALLGMHGNAIPVFGDCVAQCADIELRNLGDCMNCWQQYCSSNIKLIS